MNSLNILRTNVPEWVVIDPQIISGLAFSAHSEKAGGAPGRIYHLVVTAKKSGIKVQEQAGKQILPECCVERHINPGGTFCVFYESTNPIPDNTAAINWWVSLKQYLSDQEYAHRKREWPIHRGLSHGEAADIQMAMEELATPLGWKPELWEGMFRNKGWIGARLPKVRNSDGKMINQRSPCPRGCKYTHSPTLHASCIYTECSKPCAKIHRPVLKIDCPNKAVVNKLALLEHKRRREEKRLLMLVREQGIKCCGTMNRCPLSNRNSPTQLKAFL